jgi:predicted GTPase
MVTKILIIGAAGRDFHDFNVLFRENPDYCVVGFTATQIPYISDRIYPKELSGKLYKKGIPIYDMSQLPRLIKSLGVNVCIQAYSDIANSDVMHNASIVNAAGADFWLIAPQRTMIKSKKPVIGVCAVRTGSGKSQTSRYVAKFLRERGFKVGIVRHPMPYGVLKDQIAERFASLADLDRYKTTIEEREDYEPHIRNGFLVYAGVDYEKILRMAESENDVILWDGGNNDYSFFRTDFLITVLDPLRAGDEVGYYPGETVARIADLLLINKVNSSTKAELSRVEKDISLISSAPIAYADSIVSAEEGDRIRKRRVLVVEDGPTITHGGMKFGAGMVAAKKYGAGVIVSPKPYVVGEIAEVFKKYKHLDKELPAIGYSKKEILDLQKTINGVPCDVVISATPTDLKRIIKVNKPIVQVSYELSPRGKAFDAALARFVTRFLA